MNNNTLKCLESVFCIWRAPYISVEDRNPEQIHHKLSDLIERRAYWEILILLVVLLTYPVKKGKLVGMGTRGDPRLMVTRTSATSSSSSTSYEQVQTLEEIIRRLQEENIEIRAQSQMICRLRYNAK